MKPFTKLGNFRELQRQEWKNHPEKFEAQVLQAMRVHPDKTRPQVETLLRKLSDGVVYENDIYRVIVRSYDAHWIWLSVKRRDGNAIHDWRDLQDIKNLLVGPENEGVELYPAESRKVDTANQYHLYVLKSLDRLSIGFSDRLVIDADVTSNALTGVSQRKI